MVRSSVQHTQVARRLKEYDCSGDQNFEWSIACALKQALPPRRNEMAAAVAVKPKPRP